MSTRVLVVDDEQSLAKVVASYLERDGHEVTCVFDGPAAVDAARQQPPDVVVLDLALPGMDGVEVCRQLRTFTDCYVVMLTARTDEVDKLVGLGVGADDYLTKPFSPRELVARVRAMLRRPRTGTAGPPGVTSPPGVAGPPVVTGPPGAAGRPSEAGSAGTAGAGQAWEEEPPRIFGPLQVDVLAREVHLDGAPVALTRTEFDLLAALSARPRMAFSRRQLIDAVWGDGWGGDEHLVDVHIGHLRRKLGDDPAAPRFVRTVRGVGYRMGEG
ncbi:MAG TPA: response regulator [Micromonosporaceae bacterium]|nr:response regulator [Micromonosporaceae bacterium]